MLNKRDGPCEGSSFVDSREGLNTGEKALCCSNEGQSKRFPVNTGGKLVMISENLTSLFLLKGTFQILICHSVEEVFQSPKKVKYF